MKNRFPIGLLALSLGCITQPCFASERLSQSDWVHFSPNGTLVYKTTPKGDRIMDFSAAGYRGGGVALPSPEVAVTVKPAGNGDDAVAINKAIAQVAARPLVNGFRGAVLLSSGTFRCDSTIVLKKSGVVLRGSGSGNNGTVLLLEGKPHGAIAVQGPIKPPAPAQGAAPVRVTDTYVPSGASSLNVTSAAGLAANDTVIIAKPVTPQWVHFMGMDMLYRSGKHQTWISGEIDAQRTIARVDGTRLTFTVPLSDSLDSRFLGNEGATVVKRAPIRRLSNVGIESLRIVSPAQHVTITAPRYRGISIVGVVDSWVRDLMIENTVGSISLKKYDRRVTIEHVSTQHAAATIGAAKPADFLCYGSQVLIDRCSAVGSGMFYFATAGKVIGPNVLLNCTFNGNGDIQPHQRWATGLLVDNCHVPKGEIDFMNRGIMGSGHGWTIGWAVAWNCTAKKFLIQQPPGAYNWAIGCIGKEVKSTMPTDKKGHPSFARGAILPQGEIDSQGHPVAPASLYLAQLRQRLGPAAVKNIGY